ncbi:hypothetical protein G647_09270 [Cladophialophora carrionii CBS 160.54]|uniref:PHD-type domain-containing protein n=1 Tax=Cladophialophora carrionii CBS 160.54 TaxID=1279043 RepID=V9CYK2_9EURO|nr:uncharacterized protein G647_09270 [Cladophialophora carrionii CBS 160.54]ETI19436.1 hypothetical protein G647_09270 [Cladophialophora carrionii CBS 160.54]
MATRSLRHRSSRYSSPATFGEKEPAPKPVDDPPPRNGQQTSLDGWIEPALRPPAPSFEDSRGLERVGVLENMQPLGTAPSQRLLQKLKLTYARPSPRPTPAQIAEEVVTPATEPAEKMDLASPVEDAAAEQPPGIFPDLPPPHQAPPDTILIASPPRGRPSGRLSTEMPQPGGLSPSPITYPLAPAQHVSPKPLSIQQQLRQDRLRTHVERAIQEAQQKNTPALVNGLQRLREDAHVNYDLWNVVEAMMSNSPTPDQFKLFKRYIKSGVKQHRRESEMSASPYHPSPQRFSELTSPNYREHSPRPRHSQIPPPGYPEQPHPRLNLYISGTAPPSTYGSEEMPVSPSTVPPQLGVPELSTRTSRPTATTSPHKRKRSGSISSSSSLSPPPSDFEGVLPQDWIELDGPDGSGGSGPAARRQDKSRGPAGSRLRSSASAPNHPAQPSPEHSQPEAATASRANASKRFKKGREETEFDLDELSRRKRNFLDDSFHDYNTIPRPESSEREPIHGHPERLVVTDNPPPPVIHPNRLAVSQAAFPSALSVQPPSVDIPAHGVGRKRAYDEVEADDLDFTSAGSSSPGPLLVPPPPPGVAKAASRAATPRATRLHPAQKTRKSARVMVSPNKPKNGGITAGISRAGPGRDSRDAAIGNVNGADSGAEDNDEFCASCGGEGKLLCCDGCTNSFHHACLEPPLNPEEEVEGEWFCPRCVARRTKEAPSPAGLLGMVIRRVDDIIPKAYALPPDIREYFEGVRTGEEGEYEEVGLPRTQNNVGRMNRAGFIEEPNYKETRDGKGHIIRCYQCNLTTNGRDIIPCDFCPAKWHLDCIDPPLAVPPRRRAGDKPGAAWRCPLHVDQDLLSVSRQAEKAPGDLGRIPKPRRPKNAIPLDIAVARGFRNNGVIEVELIKDQPEADKLKELRMNGRVYRVPEMGIRLDFIDRVKKSWYEDQSFPRLMDAPKRTRNRKYRPDGAVLHHPPQQSIVKIREPDFFTGANALAITETAKANVALRNRSIREQQTVLNLARMSERGIDGYSGDALAELTNTLISEAPDKVVRAAERTEVDQLLQLQELINRRLAILNRPGNPTPSVEIGRPVSNRSVNGNRVPPAQDPNIDPILRSGGFDVPPAKTFLVQDLPIDPALQMSTMSAAPKTKFLNGDALDYGDAQDADDEAEISLGSFGQSGKAAWLASREESRLASREESRRWRDDTSASRKSTPTGYAPSTKHSVSRHGCGNGNGTGVDGVDGMDGIEMGS